MLGAQATTAFLSKGTSVCHSKRRLANVTTFILARDDRSLRRRGSARRLLPSGFASPPGREVFETARGQMR